MPCDIHQRRPATASSSSSSGVYTNSFSLLVLYVSSLYTDRGGRSPSSLRLRSPHAYKLCPIAIPTLSSSRRSSFFVPPPSFPSACSRGLHPFPSPFNVDTLRPFARLPGLPSRLGIPFLLVVLLLSLSLSYAFASLIFYDLSLSFSLSSPPPSYFRRSSPPVFVPVFVLPVPFLFFPTLAVYFRSSVHVTRTFKLLSHSSPRNFFPFVLKKKISDLIIFIVYRKLRKLPPIATRRCGAYSRIREIDEN